MTETGELRAWSGELSTRFKKNKDSPLRQIPGGSGPECIVPDMMHCFNLGFGGDLSASTLFALCEMEVFAGRSLPAKLQTAFDRFDLWCINNHKSATVKRFTKGTFKVKTTLA